MGLSSFSVEFLSAPTDNNQFQPLPKKLGKYPLLIDKTKVYQGTTQLNLSSDFLNRFTSGLKESNLFQDVGTSFILGDSKKKFNQLNITVQEKWDTHQVEVALSTGCIVFLTFVLIVPLLLFLFINFRKEFTQEMSIELVQSDGTKVTFTSKTIGQLKYGILANHEIAANDLGGKVTDSNINSIINQMLDKKSELKI